MLKHTCIQLQKYLTLFAWKCFTTLNTKGYFDPPKIKIWHTSMLHCSRGRCYRSPLNSEYLFHYSFYPTNVKDLCPKINCRFIGSNWGRILDIQGHNGNGKEMSAKGINWNNQRCSTHCLSSSEVTPSIEVGQRFLKKRLWGSLVIMGWESNANRLWKIKSRTLILKNI